MKAQLARDLKLTFRTGGGIVHSLTFFLVFGILMVLSDRPDLPYISTSAVGLIWFGVLFSSLLNLDFAFRQDFDDGTYEHLAVSPMPLESVIFAKILLHYLTTCLPLAASVPLIGTVLGMSVATSGYLVVSLLAGAPAISAIGGLGIIFGAGLRRSTLLQSVLCLPLCIPTLVFGIGAVPIDDFGQRQLLALSITAGISLVSLALVPVAAGYALRSILAD